MPVHPAGPPAKAAEYEVTAVLNFSMSSNFTASLGAMPVFFAMMSRTGPGPLSTRKFLIRSDGFFAMSSPKLTALKASLAASIMSHLTPSALLLATLSVMALLCVSSSLASSASPS